jgi:hypothetical protein
VAAGQVHDGRFTIRENPMRQRLAKREAERPDPVLKTAANTAADAAAVPSDAELLEMISEAAYYRAEKRGFSPGLEVEDWAHAEAEVRARLQAMRGRP